MMAEWWRVALRCRPEDGDAIAARLVEATGQAVEQPEDGALNTVTTSAADADALVARLGAEFPGIEARIGRIDPVDWAVRWRDGIRTRRFGRLVLTPSWLPVEPSADEVLLVIDPESAFGSGEHGSTRAALALLERSVAPGDRVLDLGSGSGILACAAVKLGARQALGIEVDEEAMPIAEANAARNHVAREVRFVTGDAADLLPLVGPAEVICSNILRSVNTMLLPSIVPALTTGGVAIFSGMEEPEAALFRPVLAGHHLVVTDECRDDGWWAVATRVS